MTNSNDWRILLRAAPKPSIRLGPPAPRVRLARLEERLGTPLPASYRAFLEVGDGGWLGDHWLFGTRVLEALESPCPGDRGFPRFPGRLGRNEGRLLPFTCPDRFGFECLLLDGPERGGVFWCPTEHPLWDQPPLPEWPPVPWWSEAQCVEIRALVAGRVPGERRYPTHEGFTDWMLDGLLGLQESAPRESTRFRFRPFAG